MLPVLIAYAALWAILLAMIAWALLAELGRRVASGPRDAGWTTRMHGLASQMGARLALPLPRRRAVRSG